jgi:hypothetical protein
MPGSLRKVLLIALQAGIFICITVLYGGTIESMRQSPQSTDFYKSYRSVRFFWDKQDIYTLIPMEPSPLSKKPPGRPTTATKTLHPNLNSPIYILFMSVFGWLTFNHALMFWSILSLCCGIMAVVMIADNLSAHGANLSMLFPLWILMLAYFPSWINFRLGQFGFVLLLLVTAIWLAFKRGAEQVAGIILGMAMALKIFLGIFLIFFAVYRRWRLLCWSVGVFLGCNLLSLLIFGISTYQKFLSLLQNMPWYAGSWNASLTGFLTRIFGGSGNNALVNLPWLPGLLASSLAIFLLFSLIWLVRPGARGMVSEQFDAGFSLALVAMLLISPYAWIYYFPILLIPVIVLWRLAGKLPQGNWYRLLLATAWILSSIPTMLIAAEDIPKGQNHIWFFTSAGYYFYALLIMAGLLLSVLWRMRKNLTPNGEPRTPPAGPG